MYVRLYVNYPLFLSDMRQSWIFETDFRKKLIWNFNKIRPVGAELFRADGQTDSDETNSGFFQFCELF
jgi:hypothetical protein